MNSIVERRMHGQVDLAQIKAELGTEFGNAYETERRGSTAVIPITGTISRRMNLFSEISGGTSIDLLQRDISAALKDDSVEAIHLMIDSPGGVVNGTKELADLIYANRGVKPIKAFVDGDAFSAAYWLSAAADEVIAFDTSMVGSIGVIMQHIDVSKQNEQQGIKKTTIFAGKYKNVGNGDEPLSKDDEKYIQALVDKTYAVFVEDVAKFRGVEVSDVLENMAEGKVFTAKDALDAGLIDRIGTWEEFFNEPKENAASTGASAKAPASSDSNKQPSFSTKNKQIKEECNMDIIKLKAEHPELFKEVCAAAKEGYVSVEASQALHSDLVLQAAKDKETIEGLMSQIANKDKIILTGEVAKHGAVAEGIKSTILAESVVPEKLHAKVAASVDFQSFVKDGDPFTAESTSGKAFATAFTTEVGSWEADMGLEASGPKGVIDSKKNGSGTDDLEADLELGRSLARGATGKIRSDAA
jgi:signal peptide peptidase SppA